jgi:Periplasmic binding protein
VRRSRLVFSKRFAERFPDLAKQERPDLGDVLGYGGALTFLEGLKRAGRDLTRPTLIAALESIKNFSAGLTMPTTFSDTSGSQNRTDSAGSHTQAAAGRDQRGAKSVALGDRTKESCVSDTSTDQVV